MEKAFRTKRLWPVIATIIIAVLCTVCLVACGGGDDETSGDSGTHTVHSYDNYVCTVCGEYSADAPVTEGLAYEEVVEDNEIIGYAVTGISESLDENITEIFIPQSYKDKPVIAIEMYAFHSCSSITSIVIPNSVRDIGLGAFYNTAYYNNESNWKYEVLYIGNYLIQAKDTISGSYAIKQGTLVIADNAFSGCSSLTNITIPNSVVSIGIYSFRGCSSLTSITIPNSVTIIGGGAFNGCVELTSVTIPNSVTIVDVGAFYGCSSLTDIMIPNGVTIIGGGAFYGCVSLTNITIPNSVTIIGGSAFAYCANLKNIKFNGTMEQWEAIAMKDWAIDQSRWMQGIKFKSVETVECIDGTITVSYD